MQTYTSTFDYPGHAPQTWGMAKFKKAILKAGHTYHSPDGKVEVTADRLRHWAGSFAKMKAAGLHVPVSWDHSDDPTHDVPIKLSATQKRRRPAKDTVGYLHDVAVSEDGTQAEITLDIRGKENAEKVAENLAFVSPVIRTQWQDGDGTAWSDIWGHMDLVQHPVDHHQSQFSAVDDTIACALRMGLDSGNPQTYRMGDTMDDDKSVDDILDDVGDDSVEDTPVNGERMKQVREALGKLGIVLSDDTNEANFLAHLENALLTADAITGEGPAADPEPLQEATPEVAAMSLDAQRWKKHADNTHRKTVAGQLDELLKAGRCTPAEHKSKSAAVGSVRLSLDDNGDHRPTAVEAWIESRSAVPAGTFWEPEQRTRLSLQEVPHPRTGDDLTSDEADSIADELFRTKK